MKKHTRKRKSAHRRRKSSGRSRRRFHMSVARARKIIRGNLRGIQRVLGAMSGSAVKRRKRRKSSRRK